MYRQLNKEIFNCIKCILWRTKHRKINIFVCGQDIFHRFYTELEHMLFNELDNKKKKKRKNNLIWYTIALYSINSIVSIRMKINLNIKYLEMLSRSTDSIDCAIYIYVLYCQRHCNLYESPTGPIALSTHFYVVYVL